MECRIRRWRIEDANDIAETLNNKKVLDNLRDGIPFPYTVEDAKVHTSDECCRSGNYFFICHYCR